MHGHLGNEERDDYFTMPASRRSHRAYALYPV
jgi:hypothetical protein